MAYKNTKHYPGKFKVGDRIRALNAGSFHHKGWTGTVLEDDDVPYILWDEEHEMMLALPAPTDYMLKIGCIHGRTTAANEDNLELVK